MRHACVWRDAIALSALVHSAMARSVQLERTVLLVFPPRRFAKPAATRMRSARAHARLVPLALTACTTPPRLWSVPLAATALTEPASRRSSSVLTVHIVTVIASLTLQNAHPALLATTAALLVLLHRQKNAERATSAVGAVQLPLHMRVARLVSRSAILEKLVWRLSTQP